MNIRESKLARLDWGEHLHIVFELFGALGVRVPC